MNKLKSPVDEGWSVHIYDRQRRLLCALEPSHGWTFLLGWGAGLICAIVWVNLAPATPPPADLDAPAPKTPLLQVD